MNRRHFLLLTGLAGLAMSPISAPSRAKTMNKNLPDWEKWQLSEAEWRNRLSPEQFHILREAGTERAFTSPLNDEKRTGRFQCAGCHLDLFTSEMKFDSGTGWPSFFTVIEGHIETSTDFKLIYPRTEYHCARCGGHHGHVFKDGPQPTGLRYCNNGLALHFVPAPS
ncbi:MAG: peptide-methionine (R)-S-oxide reductase [Gammaproteobacteria bacterium]|nr:MAG: peptide-methionine (R)-S-oxide reductase [Gammaproteobacteria bacterium]